MKLMILLLLTCAAAAQTTGVTTGTGISTCYLRFNGTCQATPPTEKEKAEDACYRDTNDMAKKLLKTPAGSLTVEDFMYLNNLLVGPWLGNCESTHSWLKGLPSKAPVEVSAVQEKRSQCVLNESHICFGTTGIACPCGHYEDVSEWTCADKSRVLMTSEDGKRHCVKLGEE